MSTNSQNKGLVFILSSPSGGGKSSLVRELLKLDQTLKLSISATTRSPRPLEIDGIDYYFKTQEDFQKLIDQDLMLEYTNIYGNYYGTLKKNIEDAKSSGLDLLFDIDWNGTKSITEKLLKKNTISIFILPPSIDVLKQRLELRKQDSEESIKSRMKAATDEIQNAEYYDYLVINDDFNDTLRKIYSIIITERVKAYKAEYLIKFSIL